VFGLVSVPWTFGFELLASLSLWPSFIASGTYFAAGSGTRALSRGLAGNLAGAALALATLGIVDLAVLGAPGLALVVGAAMFVAGLHAFVDLLSFTPAGFVGYATLFSVDAAGTQLAASGLAGIGVATVASMLMGALLGFGADLAAQWYADRKTAAAPAG
jgi:hypothetical protein